MEILLVDDEPSILLTLAEALRSDGHLVVTASDGVSASAAVSAQVFDVVICDIRLPKVDGFEVFEQVRRESPSTHCILMSAYANVPDAVTALKGGAVDYLAKPFDLNRLLERLARIGRERALDLDLRQARSNSRAGDFIGRSPPVVNLFERVEKFARSDATVLIHGESGTGKELVAHRLHTGSPRSKGPFVAVNCAVFPEALLEAELFGHEKGAFTGAIRRRDGRFKAAEGGTLFLDEVAELPVPSQGKLLRVLQEGTFEPLGTNASVTTDVRIISATHRNLKELVAARQFREDLYYRLNVLELSTPPLRERVGDLPLLIDHFLRQFAVKGGEQPSLSARALAALSEYRYPGNVRELGHAIQHASILAAGGEIDLHHLPRDIVGTAPVAPGRGTEGVRSLGEAVRSFEREYVKRVMRQANGKRTRAAQMLGISRKNLWEKLRGFGFDDSEVGPSDRKKS